MNRLDELQDPYAEVAGRFDALARLFAQFANSKAANELIDSLLADDGKAFNRLIDSMDLPLEGKCFWVREIVETVVSTPVLITECCLRDDLTRDERIRYVMIARRHVRGSQILIDTRTLSIEGSCTPIPPGPFLDELKANGLVTCKTSTKFDGSIALSFGQPERICLNR